MLSEVKTNGGPSRTVLSAPTVNEPSLPAVNFWPCEPLSLPDSLKKYVSDGTIKQFVLWKPNDLGFLAAYAAVEAASGKIDGSQGQQFTAGKLGSFTVGADKTVLLGPPFTFDSANIGQFDF